MSLSVTEIFIAHSTHLAEKSSQVKSFPGILLEGLLKVIAERCPKRVYEYNLGHPFSHNFLTTKLIKRLAIFR